MIRKFKTLGLAIVAVLAMSAVAASAAQATPGTVTLDGGNTTEAAFHAAQVAGESHTFTLPNKRVLSCAVATFTGTVKNGDTAVTAAPTYENCHVTLTPNTWPATVFMNGCDYNFTLQTKIVGDVWDTDAHLECPETDVVIEVYVPGTLPSEHTVSTKLLCRYTVQEQTVQGVTATDNTNGTVNVDATNAGVAISKVFGTLANCGGNGTATYNGKTPATASSGGVPVSLGLH
jgi:hypothetical protein